MALRQDAAVPRQLLVQELFVGASPGESKTHLKTAFAEIGFRLIKSGYIFNREYLADGAWRRTRIGTQFSCLTNGVTADMIRHFVVDHHITDFRVRTSRHRLEDGRWESRIMRVDGGHNHDPEARVAPRLTGEKGWSGSSASLENLSK